MNNIERIFEAVCNILSVYVSFKVTDVFLEKKRKLPPGWQILSMCSYGLLIQLLHLVF